MNGAQDAGINLWAPKPCVRCQEPCSACNSLSLKMVNKALIIPKYKLREERKSEVKVDTELVDPKDVTVLQANLLDND